jgi:hypothetical protein
MLLEGIDWKRPDRTWQPLMAVKNQIGYSISYRRRNAFPTGRKVGMSYTCQTEPP